MKKDLFYKERVKILGGPGCGKTTRLLKVLKTYLDNGLAPDRALMVGFANATVDNLRDRCEEELNYSSIQTDSIKTIHKYCLDHLDDYKILTVSDKKEFKKKLKTDSDNWIKINTPEYDEEDQKEEFATWNGIEDGKIGLILNIVSLARHNRLKDWDKGLTQLMQYYDKCYAGGFEFKIQRDEVQYIYTQYENFKKQNNLIDFEDMLHKALHSDIVFDYYKLLIVDECQDLSKLEWKVVAKLSKNSEDFYLAGDDDQAIFGWKGSDVRIFQKWPIRRREILPYTHRLPRKIYKLAQSLTRQIEKRMGNTYKVKKDEEGVLGWIAQLEEIENKIKVGANMIMCARSWNKCEYFVRYLKDKGLVWQEKTTEQEGRKFTSSVSANVKNIINNWSKLQKGEGIKGTEVMKLIKEFKEDLVVYGKKTALTNTNLCPREFLDESKLFTFSMLKKNYFVLADIKKPWFDIFIFKSQRVVTSKRPHALYENRNDYNNYLKRAYQLDPTFKKTDILVSTIHGVKGMERDIVVMSSVWTWPSYKNFKQGTPLEQDEEVRVAYVGVSRAKHELYLFEPMIKKSENYFPLLNPVI
jgi:DNA helicase-2/ATP-dependent DNA helicase PcrA